MLGSTGRDCTSWWLNSTFERGMVQHLDRRDILRPPREVEFPAAKIDRHPNCAGNPNFLQENRASSAEANHVKSHHPHPHIASNVEFTSQIRCWPPNNLPGLPHLTLPFVSEGSARSQELHNLESLSFRIERTPCPA